MLTKDVLSQWDRQRHRHLGHCNHGPAADERHYWHKTEGEECKESEEWESEAGKKIETRSSLLSFCHVRYIETVQRYFAADHKDVLWDDDATNSLSLFKLHIKVFFHFFGFDPGLFYSGPVFKEPKFNV